MANQNKKKEQEAAEAAQNLSEELSEPEKIIQEAEQKAKQLEKKAIKAAEKIINDAKKAEAAANKKIKELDKKLNEAVDSGDAEIIDMIPENWENQSTVKVMNKSATTYFLPQYKKIRGKTVKIWPEQIEIPGSTNGDPVFVEIPKYIFDEMTNKDINKARILTKKQAAERIKLLDERRAVENRINQANLEDKSKLYRTTRPTPKQLFLIRNPMPQEV